MSRLLDAEATEKKIPSLAYRAGQNLRKRNFRQKANKYFQEAIELGKKRTMTEIFRRKPLTLGMGIRR